MTREGLEVTRREFLRMYGKDADWQRDAIPLYAMRVSPDGVLLHYPEFLQQLHHNSEQAWKLWWRSPRASEKRTAPDGKNYGKRSFHHWYGKHANYMWAVAPRPSERRVDASGQVGRKSEFVQRFGEV